MLCCPLWALWAVSQYPYLNAIVKKAAEVVASQINREELSTLVLNTSKAEDTAPFVALGSIIPGIFDSEFWTMFHDKFLGKVAVQKDIEWLAKALVQAVPEKAAEWGIQMDNIWSDESVWNLYRSRFALWGGE
jgi:hypothetical protein